MGGEGITMDELTEVQDVALQYGTAVAWREYYAEDAGYEFQDYDRQCKVLWKKLIALGGYVDDEGSELKPEVRPYYLEGLESVPQREIDYEEYWEHMWEEFGDEE